MIDRAYWPVFWSTHLGSAPGQSALVVRVRMGCGTVAEVHGGGAQACLRCKKKLTYMPDTLTSGCATTALHRAHYHAS